MFFISKFVFFFVCFQAREQDVQKSKRELERYLKDAQRHEAPILIMLGKISPPKKSEVSYLEFQISVSNLFSKKIYIVHHFVNRFIAAGTTEVSSF